MKANKSQIFSKAWSLFRKYQITFAQALVKAWNDAKRSFYIEIYNSIQTKPSLAKKKAEAKKIFQSFEITFSLTQRNIADTSGAVHYYDGKTLNMD